VTAGGTPPGRETVVVLDFGAQYSQLIARRVRELHVYSEILPFDVPLDTLRRRQPIGIILSGGPDSVYSENAPRIDPALFESGIPILGICYGTQLMAHQLQGRVVQASQREYGPADLEVIDPDPLFETSPRTQRVWMSHGDEIVEPPPGFVVTARSANTACAAMIDRRRRLYGIQFHPEVSHTVHGGEILAAFLRAGCGCRADWRMSSFVDEAIRGVRDRVGTAGVVAGLSGGVDSAVVALLIHRAVGPQLTCLFIDNGLLRHNEAGDVLRAFQDDLQLPVRMVSAGDRFLAALRGVDEPEEKRKIVGRVFVEEFEREAAGIGGAGFLAQGTLYPDRIESTSGTGPSEVIKTHHNVGGLPPDMTLKLVEPLRDLFKDEARGVGRELGLPESILLRHPFPGPGLAVRVLGEVTRERLETLRQVDDIFIRALRETPGPGGTTLYESTAQAFAVLLPVRSVGVMGDGRTYENVVALRAVTSDDFMTADWARLPQIFLAAVSARIVNTVRGVNRVVYDISSKPPSTIEWE
jgi:GMP synthase (glutamine-hydrolysing)